MGNTQLRRKSEGKGQQDETKDSAEGANDSRSASEDLMSERDITRVAEATADARKAFIEGNRFFRAADFNAAKIHFSWALRILQNRLTDVEHQKAIALSNIGLIEFADGRYSEAKALLNEAHNMSRDCNQKSSPSKNGTIDFDESMKGLESLCVELSRDHQIMFWKSSNPNPKRLAVALKQHESVDIIIADSLNNLAACMEMLGDNQDAKPLYEESLRLRMIVYGEHSLKVAESMQNLATVLHSQGHLKEAESMLKKAFITYVSLLGDGSPEVAVTVNNLAVLKCHLGEKEKARELLEQTVRARTAIYGEDHQFTKCAKQNLDYVLNNITSVENFDIENKKNSKLKKGKSGIQARVDWRKNGREKDVIKKGSKKDSKSEKKHSVTKDQIKIKSPRKSNGSSFKKDTSNKKDEISDKSEKDGNDGEDFPRAAIFNRTSKGDPNAEKVQVVSTNICC